MRSIALLAALSLPCLPASSFAQAPAPAKAAKPAKPAKPGPARPTKPLPKSMLGAWAVDIDATLDTNPELAKMPPQAQAQVKAQSQAILGGMRFEFTADGRAIAAMRGQAEESRYTVSEQAGDVVSMKMLDPDGREHQMRLTLKDGRLRLEQGGQSMVLMRPPPEAKAPGDPKTAPAAPPKK